MFPCGRKFRKKESWHVVTCLLQLTAVAILACVLKTAGGEGRERRRLAFRLKGDTVCSDLLVSQRQHCLIFNHKARLKELYSYIVMYFILLRDGTESSPES